MPKHQNQEPRLRFLPNAWSKLLYLRDRGQSEVGGFGISRPDDLLLIEDVRLVRQGCTQITVEFDDSSIADFFDEQIDLGRRPAEFGRIWVHTHPGSSPHPSPTDEETLAHCFSSSDWSVMFILACGGQAYARLTFTAGPGGSVLLPVEVDYQSPFPATDQPAWEQEYLQNVSLLSPAERRRTSLETIEPDESLLADELFGRDVFFSREIWDEEGSESVTRNEESV